MRSPKSINLCPIETSRNVTGNKLSQGTVKSLSFIIGSAHKIRRTDRKPDSHACFYKGDQDIEADIRSKYLGVQKDQLLSWEKYIQDVKTKCLRSLGRIKHAKRYIQKSCRAIPELMLTHMGCLFQK